MYFKVDKHLNMFVHKKILNIKSILMGKKASKRKEKKRASPTGTKKTHKELFAIDVRNNKH